MAAISHTIHIHTILYEGYFILFCLNRITTVDITPGRRGALRLCLDAIHFKEEDHLIVMRITSFKSPKYDTGLGNMDLPLDNLWITMGYMNIETG